MFSVFECIFVLQCDAFIVIVLSNEPTKAEPRARVGRQHTS